MGDVYMAIMAYMVREGEYPASLDALVQRLYQIKKEDLVDPWGEPIGYEHSGGDYIIWSSGPDKKLGTADDIIRGSHPSYEASWKAKLAQALGEQGTNAVQGATAGTIQPPASIGKTPSNSVPAVTAQPPAEPDNPAGAKTTPWKIPLLVGVLAIVGVMLARRCFRKGGKDK